MAELSANGGGDITLQFATAEVSDPSRLAVSRTQLRTRLGERLSMRDLSAQPAWVKDLRSIWDSTKEANEGAPRTPVMEEEEEEGKVVSPPNMADGATRTPSTEKF